MSPTIAITVDPVIADLVDDRDQQIPPVTTSTAGKIFAGVYAIYCGIALIGTTGVIMAPIIHRGLHKFHLEDSDPQR